MLDNSAARSKLLSLLRAKSVFRGDFLLASGARSTYYIDCRLTTLDPEGAWLVGQTMHSIIRAEALALSVQINSAGGLTLGADASARIMGRSEEATSELP